MSRFIDVDDDKKPESVQKLLNERAADVLKRFIGCQKRIKNCYGSCDKCKWSHTEPELRRAVETLLNAFEVRIAGTVPLECYKSLTAENEKLKLQYEHMRAQNEQLLAVLEDDRK